MDNMRIFWPKGIASAMLLLIVLALSARAGFCRGSAALPTSLSDAPIVDMHVHLAGLGSGGCVAPHLRGNPPLLGHTGQERSSSGARGECGDPCQLALPLSLDVTVIAGHVATTGYSAGEENFRHIVPIFAQYPTLYTDSSSLTRPNKPGYIEQALGVGPDVFARSAHLLKLAPR